MEPGFQLTSKPSSSRFDWLAGAFYYNDRQELQLDTYNTCIGNVCAPGAPPTQNTGYPTTKSYSGYADGTYRFFSATKLTVGLRYTSETKGLSGLVCPCPAIPIRSLHFLRHAALRRSSRAARPRKSARSRRRRQRASRRACISIS